MKIRAEVEEMLHRYWNLVVIQSTAYYHLEAVENQEAVEEEVGTLMFPRDDKDLGKAAEENQGGHHLRIDPILGLHLHQQNRGDTRVTFIAVNPTQSPHLLLSSLGVKVRVTVKVAEIEEETLMRGAMIL